MDEQDKKIEQTVPAEETAPETEKQFSDEKKSALMRYLTVMFAVAFIMVLVSFLIQNHSSNQQITKLSESTSSALVRAEALQTQNRELEDENEKLKQELEALTEQEQTSKTDSRELSKKVETYEALVTAMSCETREGNLSFSKAMETLKANQSYLSEPAKQLYRTLLTETAGE